MTLNRTAILLSLTILATGCATHTPVADRTTEVQPSNHSLANREDVFAILRYVYLWHFDESQSFNVADTGQIEVWIREIDMPLDDGDHSRFAEVWLPQIHLLLSLKQANYSISELGIEVKNDNFKVHHVSQQADPEAPKSAYQIATFPRTDVVEHLFETRNEKRFPDATLRASLRSAMFENELTRLEDIVGDQIIHIAPISAVSNDLWVYHENMKRLIRFSADMDLNNPAYWSDTSVHVTVYDLETDVVVSPDEAPGSDGYLTKDFTGRALFNCVVLGLRLQIPEADAREAYRTFQVERQ